MDMISVGLQKSLVAAQHKLWMAIKEHQKSSQQLSGVPNDPQDKQLQGRMKMIEIKILEIDRWQKDLYCQLRKEIAALNSETALHAAKLWLAEALQLNNNNHIIRNGVNGHASSSSNVSEDEEPPPQQNGDVASPLRGQHSPTSFKGREASTSGSEECSPVDVQSEDESSAAAAAAATAVAPEAEDKKCFMGRIGLISHERLGEIERRRNQRKRRRNVRSQFLYSAPQPPQKRKRYAYLQSGNAPQTRQTTARLNGPSPTPPTKSSNGPGRKPAKLIQPGRAASNNSVLRNGDAKQQPQQHKEFSIKQKTDNGNGTMKISSTGKTVHIPGLPPSLTVEWIDKDSNVCVSCRNPGSLTMCDSCASKFHVSCHTTSPASTSHCPKCVTRFPVKAIGGCGNDLEILRHEVKHVKKEYRDKGAAGESSRAHGKAGENAELHKALGELYKADAAQARQQQQQSLVAFDIKQLPSSTLLIPITSSATAIATATAAAAAAAAAASHDDDNSNFGSKSGFVGDMAEIVRQLPETSVTTTAAASRNEWRRLALQSSGQIQSIVQRRPSNEGTSIKPSQSLFPLQPNLPDRSSTGVRPQSSLSLIKPRTGNYVTVEIVDEDGSDDEDNRPASENSADGAYAASEGSHRGPDVIDLEPQSTVAEPARQEPEVFNISSGSSELNASGSLETESEPQVEPAPESEPTSEPAAAAESSNDDLETSAKSPGSPASSPKRDDESTGDVARSSPAPSSPDNEQQPEKQPEPVGDGGFLGTIFPGEFGYRILIQIVPPESDEDGDNGETADPDDERQQQQQQQHVKLEEAHLPAPLGPELNTAVPDNKSDDAVSQDSTSQDSTGVDKPTEQSEPTATTD